MKNIILLNNSRNIYIYQLFFNSFGTKMVDGDWKLDPKTRNQQKKITINNNKK